MKTAAAVFVGVVALGCNGPTGTTGNGTTGNPSNDPPVKLSARELNDAYKIGKSYDGKRVEVTGFVRAVEADRSNGKATLEGGDEFTARIDVHFNGPISGISRGDTITVTGTMKGKIKSDFGEVPTITEATLGTVQKKKKKGDKK